MVDAERIGLISCDEAGFTGPKLLDADQPFFVYASHDLTVEESEKIIAELRSAFPIQSDEIKTKLLKRRAYWKNISSSVCKSTVDRAKVIAYDKKVALAGKFFEYFFEPILSRSSMLFYGINFHRFIMNTLHQSLDNATLPYSSLAEEIQGFMRTFDPVSAPSLFGSAVNGNSVAMERILKFVSGYSNEIVHRNSHLRPEQNAVGKWTLDLTTTAFFSLLFRGWGFKYKKLTMLCDDSKPLKENVDFFNLWVGKDQTLNITDAVREVPVRGNLVSPVEFGSSHTHPTLQVADLLAGITLEAWARPSSVNADVHAWVRRHMHEDHIVHDNEMVKKNHPVARISREVLKELARRADGDLDPLDGMIDFVRRQKSQL